MAKKSPVLPAAFLLLSPLLFAQGKGSAWDVAVLRELNAARTRPAAYIALLRDYRSHIHGGMLEYPDQTPVRLNEGTRAVDEAIAFLKRQEPLDPLALSKGLSAAARDLAADQGKTGGTGHAGSDGSSPPTRMSRHGKWLRTAGENCAYGPEDARQIVIQLIVDDGVPSRGHRANIFNPAFKVVGVAVGPHPRYRFVSVMDFAGGYREK